MKKIVALYRAPDDAEAFLAHYRDVHIPLVIAVTITRSERTLVGESGHFLIAEMSFADDAALKTALKSPENAVAGEDAMAFAGKLVTVMTAATLPL